MGAHGASFGVFADDPKELLLPPPPAHVTRTQRTLAASRAA
jgi:hypothetical protein